MKHASTQKPQRQISFLVMLIVAIATPATLALSWYQLTGDPTFQPLALSVERLAEVGIEAGDPKARVVIHSNDTAADRARAEVFGRRIHAAFYGKGVEASVFVKAAPGNGPMQVTYVVGKRRFGPYETARAVDGIHETVQVLQLQRQARDAQRPHRW